MRDWQKISAIVLWTTATAGLGGVALAEVGGGFGMHGFGPMMGGAGIEALFDTLDADRDGKVTEAEIEAHHAARVAAIDADGDGKLSAEELVADRLRGLTEVTGARVSAMIGRLDADGDELLSAAELAAGPARGTALLWLDADGDGSVTQEEVETLRDAMLGGAGPFGQGFGGGWWGQGGMMGPGMMGPGGMMGNGGWGQGGWGRGSWGPGGMMGWGWGGDRDDQ